MPGTDASAQRRRHGGADFPGIDKSHREAENFAEGERYYILEDFAKALLYFQNTVEINPANGAAHFKIAEIYLKSNREADYQRAAQSIEEAIRLDKKNKYYYILASSIYSGLSNFGRAEQTLETMMKEVKGTEEYLYQLAALYQYDRKPMEAIRVYNRAEAVMGINEVSSLQKQKLYLENEQIDEALKEGEKLMAAFPDEERYVLDFVETLAQYGQRQRAIAFLEKYMASHPDASDGKVVLANFYRDDGKEEQSRKLLVDIFNDPTQDFQTKVMVVGQYQERISSLRMKNAPDAGMEEFALSLANRLLQDYDYEANAHLVAADIFNTLGKSSEAQRAYRRAIQLGTTTFEAWQNLLFLESADNAFDSLIAHTEAGLELFPNQGMLYYFNGYAHLRKKHYREAATSLEQSRKLSTGNIQLIGEINGMLGDTYNGLKDYPKSDRAYEDALAFNPSNDYVLNNYSYYLALRKENLEKAEKMSSQLVKEHPDNANYLDTYAWVLYAREKYRDAKKAMERAIETGGAGAAHFEHYGDILFRLGQTDEAVTQWKKARGLQTTNAALDRKISNRSIE